MSNQQERPKFELGNGQTIARIRKGSLDFEIIVDMEEALKFRKGQSEFLDVHGDRIFTNVRKGDVASVNDLEIAFGIRDVLEIGKKIVKGGDVLVDQSHRDEEKDKKVKQVVDFLTTNAIDPQSGNPISPERIKSALSEAHVHIKNMPIENQIKEILDALSKIIPIKIETRRVKIIIPAIQTGKAYGLVTQYKEKENWLDDGSLEVIVSIPAGIVMDFYDKLNSITHGSALTEDLEE
ncbi:ribosome assembly factor SBDS [archaeon]|jgi:ribosome maturation protein SDO1|nr:ribosome assembly factor SBDS [archaeon]